MAKINIDKDKCKGCLLCVTFCPKGLIKKGNKVNVRGWTYVEFIDDGRCLGCSHCALVCPDWCIEVEK